jgi:hypothetical protein
MKKSNSSSRIVFVALAVSMLAAAIITARAAGQDEQWQIQRADYGWRDRRVDVTGLLIALLSRGGVNGRVAVNNQTMGGDPAVGADKNLRIFARNRRGAEREFDFKEGGAIDITMFELPRNDWGDRDNGPGNGPGYGQNDRPEWRGFQIIRGFYGVQGRTVNVTDMLRGRVGEGVLSIRVENGSLGGDPAVGADKVLIVIYRYQGQEQATAVREGNTLTIP